MTKFIELAKQNAFFFIYIFALFPMSLLIVRNTSYKIHSTYLSIISRPAVEISIPTPTINPTRTITPAPIETLAPPPIPTPLSSSQTFAPASEDEILIVVAEFSYSEGVLDTNVHQEIKRILDSTLNDLGIFSVRVEIWPMVFSANGKDAAEELGKLFNASIMIWGEDSEHSVTVEFLNLKSRNFDTGGAVINGYQTLQEFQPVEYTRLIINDLPNQLTYLSLFAIGQVYYSQYDPETAIILLDKIMEILSKEPGFENNPVYAQIFNNRGVVYADLGEYESAIADFDHAIELDSEYAPAFYHLGVVYADLGNYVIAIENFTQAIAIDPEYANAFLSRAIVFLNLGQNVEAIADLQTYLELDPQSPQRITIENLIKELETKQEN